jgi:Ca2+-binding RTX toxin-like protein
MRRGTITILVVAALLALVPGLALARDVACRANAIQCEGTNERDVITGSQGEDVILAKGGNDTVEGRGSDDEISGGRGDDRLRDNSAAEDADEILAGRGNDTINVEDGDTGEPSEEDPLELILDEVDCGRGIDTVVGADEADLIDGETCERGENIDPPEEEPEEEL